MKDKDKNIFIPTMNEREIAKNIVFREIKSWHRLSYAGEGLKFIPGTKDRSGCIDDDGKCHPPFSVCHRIYYHKKNPKFIISAILSYPNGLALINEYFWETLGTKRDDIERFFGKNAERKMEKKIIRVLRREFRKIQKKRRLNETTTLTTKQRVMRARWGYIKGMKEIWERLKKKYNLTDDLLYDLVTNPSELDLNKIWEEELNKLRSRLEKKYNVCIEHDDDIVRCFAW